MVMNRCAAHRYSSSVRTGLLGLLFLLSPFTPSQAQVVTNIQATRGALDLGTITNAIVDLPTNVTTTAITGGTRPNNGTAPGTNLFHSFDSFTLGTGDVAHFQNNMQRPTTNIFARVIGPEVSTIDGILRTNFPGDSDNPLNFGPAHLWLVNPSGLLLGPNARVEVGGSVSMSTANYLRFDGTALFDMLSTPASLGQLSVAPVTAFGFLGPELPAPITIQGSILEVPEGQALSLVGGDITIQAASLLAPGGQINLVSVASPGEVLVPSFQTGSFTTMGAVTIKESATLDVSGQLDEFGTPIGNGNGGTVFVRGGSLIVDNSTIEAKTLGDLDGANPGIDLSLTDTVTLTNGARLSVATGDFSMGRPGDVRITTSNLELSQGATIETTGSFGLAGLGAAADILLNVNSLSLTGGSVIFSNTFDVPGGNITIRGFEGAGTAANDVLVAGTAPTGLSSEIRTETQGVGTGGNLSVSTGSLTLADQGRITSATSFGNGQGGEIVLNVESVNVSTGASIRSATDNFFDVDQGVGGNVTIQGLGGPETSAGSVTVSGQDSLGAPSGIFSGSIFGIARPGNILVEASTFTLSDGAVVQSGSPFDITGGGSITVRASDSVNISNGSSISNQALTADAGPVSITTSALNIDNGSINTSTLSSGRAGDVIINARNVSLTNGSRIESSTADFGAAGSVVIQGQGGEGTRANDVTIRGQDATGQPGGLFTSTGKAGIFENPAADGAGGDITVVTNTFTLEDGASISAASSSISPLAKGGSITVDATLATVRTGAVITAESIRTTEEGGAAPGGDVGITAQALTLDQGSLSAATAGSGDGGSITVNAGTFTAQGNSQITSSTTGAGNAGSITANVGTLSLTGGAQITSASTGTASGAAGSVTIQGLASPADAVTLTNSSLLTSADSTGRGGSITVDATKLTLNGATISASVKDVNAADGTDAPTSGLGNIALTSSTMKMTGGTVTAATSGTRNAGTITLTTTGNTLNVGGGGSITSSTSSSGNAGQILITSPVLSLNNGTITTSTTSSGNAGSITANVGTLSLTGGAQITSASTGTASGAAGSVTIQGLASPANAVTLTNSSLRTSADSTGRGGSITVDATKLTLNGATISASVKDVNAADGTDAPTSGLGNIALTSSTMSMTGGLIKAETSGTRNAGTITLNANTVTLQGKATVSSSSTGKVANAGDAGSVTINNSGSFTSNGSTVATSAANAKGGAISIRAQSVQLANGTLISASSDAPLLPGGEGDAGNITIHSGSTFVMKNSKVTTEASLASGGRIEINAPEMVRLTNSRISTSVAGFEKDTLGGNILIDPQFVILQNNSQVIARAFAGTGGKIDIIAGVYLQDPSSQVDASSTLGISGEVNIQSPVQNVAGRLTPLSQQFSSAAALLAQRCAARVADGKFSTFVIAGREGLPVEPGGFLASPSLTAELLGSNLSGWDLHTQFSAVTGLFQEYDARPIQLAKLGNACH